MRYIEPVVFPGPGLSFSQAGRHVKPFNLALCALVCCLFGCGQSGSIVPSTTALPTAPVTTSSPSIWVGSWGDAITNHDASPENSGGTERSYRFLVTPSIGGTKERVRFSNFYGSTPITIGAARLAVGKDGSSAVDSTHDVALSFAGQPSLTIAPGQVAVSDPVSLNFSYGQVLAISVYLPGTFGPVDRHSSIFVTNYATQDNAGNQTADATGAALTQTLGDWLLINGVDVYGSYQGTFALFGSSTTDGFHSNYGDDQIYPTPNVPIDGQHTSRLSDWLAARLNAAGYHIGVVNLGIPGDTVTDDTTNITGDVQNANQRVGHDLLTLPNLLAAVTYFGSIDIRSVDCKSAPAIESATSQLIATAAAAKVPIVLATIPPSAFCTNPAQPNFGPLPSPSAPYAGGVTPGPANGGELQRIAFNQWIRATGASLPGVVGIADFDQVLADPSRPSFLLPQFNSGDNYHPNGNGYHTESSAIPLSVLPAPH